MSHEHHHGCCCSGSHSHEHCHCHGSGACGSHHGACACPCHHEHNHAAMLLKLADEAWLEVVKEKIKEEIRKNSNDHTSQLAKVVAEANHKRWAEKMAAKKCEAEYEEQLKRIFGCKDAKCGH